MNTTKKGIVLADMHCGHRTGLTMPKYWKGSCLEIQKVCWEWLDEISTSHGPFDFALWGGDLIEGKMKKNSGVELIEPSCLEQASMAQDVVEHINAKENLFTYGTPYHVSDDGEDYERLIADNVGGIISDQILVDIGGTVINLRHHVGGSSMPFNWTALSKEKIADILWADACDRKAANIIMRAHVHRHHFQGGIDPDGAQWVAMTLPCLQLWTKFGGRRVTSPPINYGVTILEIGKGTYSWQTHTMSLKGLQEVIAL